MFVLQLLVCASFYSSTQSVEQLRTRSELAACGVCGPLWQAGSPPVSLPSACRFLFWQVDTITKRLMSNKTNYRVPGQTMHNLNKIIFKQSADAGAFKKAFSLFPGLGFAAGYKITQRVYKFGGQPFVNDQINTTAGGWFKKTFGEKTGKTLMHATAGSIIGIGEVLLLPLDVLKIKAQTNPAAFGELKGLGMAKMLWTEGRGLYAGAGATMMRNAPGRSAAHMR